MCLLAAGSGADRQRPCTIQRKPDALLLLWEVRRGALLGHVAPPDRCTGLDSTGEYCTACTSKRMMYCVLTLPGKAEEGVRAWPRLWCNTIRDGGDSNSTRSPATAQRGRYRVDVRYLLDVRYSTSTTHTVRSTSCTRLYNSQAILPHAASSISTSSSSSHSQGCCMSARASSRPQTSMTGTASSRTYYTVRGIMAHTTTP